LWAKAFGHCKNKKKIFEPRIYGRGEFNASDKLKAFTEKNGREKLRDLNFIRCYFWKALPS
jgi:hypothetical protein